MNASFQSFSDGAKKLSLNEKERGFPLGLRMMSEAGAGNCIFHIPSSFDSVRIRDGQSKVLTGVEVSLKGLLARTIYSLGKIWLKFLMILG